MRFRGQVHDGIDFVIGEQLAHEGGVHDVALDKDVPCVIGDGGEVFEIARVGEFIQVDDEIDVLCALCAGWPEEIMDQIGSDEAGAAGDKEFHGVKL